MAKLYFYYSAMNAGKTTLLLQSNYNYQARGMGTVLYTPQLDDRYGVGKITSRIGLQAESKIFDDDYDLFAGASAEMRTRPIHCVLVDEAQFMTPAQVLQCTLIVDRLDVPVLTYGLRSDFRGEPFPGAIYLLAWADELCEIKTIGASGKKATMNARLDDSGQRVWSGEQVAIGHNYVSMTRSNFRLEKASPIDYTPPASSTPDSALE